MATITAAWKDWEGQVVSGKFLLKQYLGSGQASAVFLTEYAAREQQKAAIKLVIGDWRDTDLVLSRWERAAELSHPHLVRSFARGRWQLTDLEGAYVVMEYADEDLSQVLPTRPLTPAEARDVLEPALDVLAYLHEKGFVHGHLKPSNVMAVEEQLKVSSDGVLRLGDPGTGPLPAGIYKPPEMMSGDISPASDVWALGVTLSEALTQHPPEIDLPPRLPAPFDEIVRNCLQPDPSRRWSVGRIAARLRETAAVPGIPPRATQDEVRSTSRKYIVPAVVAGLGLAAVAALIAPRAPDSPPELQKPAADVPAPAKQPAEVPKPAQTVEQPSHSPAPRAEPTSRTTGSTSEIIYKPKPTVPPEIRNTIRGTVRVKVKVFVDPSGSVAYANLESPGPSRYFAARALETARLWKFKAPSTEGRNGSSIWILRFAFRPKGTQIAPTRMAP